MKPNFRNFANPKSAANNPHATRAQDLFNEGLALHQKGRLAQAKAIYEKLLKTQPKHFDALHLLGVIATQTKNHLLAVQLIDKAIAVNPNIATAYCNRGDALQALKRFDEALMSYDQAINLKADFVEAYNNRGNALLELKRLDEALISYDQAIQIKADFAEAYGNRGNALEELKRFDEALASYDQAIKLKADYAKAYCNRGNALQELKRFDEALMSCDQAIQLKADFAEAYYNRGNALLALMRFDEALASHDQAINLRADFAEAYYNRGISLHELKRFDEALASHDQAIKLKADYAEAHCNRANALQELKRFDEALASHDQAIKLKADYAKAYCNRGMVLQKLNRFDEALTSYDQAITLKQEYAIAFNNRGQLNSTLRRYRAAIEDFDAALGIKPDIPDLFGMRLHMKMAVCDWSELEAQKELLVGKIDRGERAAASFAAMTVLDSLEMQGKCAQIWVKSQHLAGASLGSLCPPPRHKRIRVAYVSSEFRESPGAYNLVGLFENHDRTRYETIALSSGPDSPDEMRSRLKRAFDVFVDVGKKTDGDIAALMREMEIDIAVDIAGPTGDNRPGIFLARGAPIQVNHFSFTSGASYFEYIVADPIALPADHRDYYSEKMACLPYTLFATDNARSIAERTPTRAEAGLPDEGFVFCSFNNSYKITPEVFDVWMRLLNKVAGSVLWLRETNSLMPGNLREEAHKRGIDPARLVFAPIAPKMEDHLARLRLADLFVDCFAFNAQTTASDALWAGVPVLTCLGKSMVSRVAGSLLNAIDMPELITQTRQDYEALALALATDPPRLAKLRQKLTDNRLTKPLFDTPRYARHLEDAYLQMYERYHAGLPPEHIRVAP